MLETSLIRFYAFMRAELMRLQSESEMCNGFTELALQVGETRAAWQQKGDLLKSTHTKEVHEPESPAPRGAAARHCCGTPFMVCLTPVPMVTCIRWSPSLLLPTQLCT